MMKEHNDKFALRQDKLNSEMRQDEVLSPILHEGNDLVVDNYIENNQINQLMTENQRLKQKIHDQDLR